MYEYCSDLTLTGEGGGGGAGRGGTGRDGTPHSPPPGPPEVLCVTNGSLAASGLRVPT